MCTASESTATSADEPELIACPHRRSHLRFLSSTAFVRSDVSESVAAKASSAETSPANATTSAPEPEQSPAPIDQQTSTELPTEEIPAVSSSLDASVPKSEDAAAAKPSQPTPEEIAEKVSRTVFVAGLAWTVTDEVLVEEIHKHLEAEEGVSQVRIATDPAGRSKG